MSKRATLVVTATPSGEEMDSVQAYLQGVLPLFTEAGGTLVKRLRVDNVLRGQASAMVMVMDFESESAINQLFDLKEYAELIPVRDRGFKEMNILVTQEM